MNWNIRYTLSAKQDLRDILDYVSEELLEPAAARRLVSRIMEEIGKLKQMPERHRVYEKEPWRSRGLRVFPVKKYLVFYLPDPGLHEVTVVRIFYGGRDIRTQLSETEE